MKIDKNVLGKNILARLYGTIKSKINNINIVPNNMSIKFTNANGDLKIINLNGLTKYTINKFAVSHNGVLNLNPGCTLGDIDYKDFKTAGGELVKDSPPGAVLGLKYDGGCNFKLDTPMPLPKDKSYKLSFDIKALYDGAINTDLYVSMLVGIAPYDGDDVNWDSNNKIYLGNHIESEMVNFVGSDANDCSTAYKYTLTKDFNKGDEYLYFRTSDINNIYLSLLSNGDVNHYKQTYKFYRDIGNKQYVYTGKNGKEYTELGYSADVLFRLPFIQLDTSKAKDDKLAYFIPTGNTIDGETEYKAKINTANSSYTRYMWRGKYDIYPAGSVMIQSSDAGGGTYMYWVYYKDTPADGRFNRMETDWINLENNDGMNNRTNTYRDGTSIVKLLVLGSYKVGKYQGDIDPDKSKFTTTLGNLSIEYKNND